MFIIPRKVIGHGTEWHFASYRQCFAYSITACLLVVFALAGLAQSPAVYPYYMNPSTYPDYTRRLMPAPDWSVFQNRPQFVCSRQWIGTSYFASGWKPYQFTFTPSNSGLATVSIQNVNCDGTVLVDNVYCQATNGAPELLQNSDFEGSSGWSLGTGTAYTTAEHHSGTRCVLVATNSYVQASPAPTGLQVGHTYACSVWLKTAASGLCLINFGNSTAGGKNWWFGGPTANNDWEQFYFLLTPTALTGNYNQFRVLSQSPSGPAIYVDDFSVKEVNTGAPNLLTNGDFQAADPGQGWTRTEGVNVYPVGCNSQRSMLIRAGHSLQTQVSVQQGSPYQITCWLSIAGRSQGQVQISAAGAGMGTGTLAVAEETTANPSGLVLWPNVSSIVNTIDNATLSYWTNYGVIMHDPGGYGPGAAWSGSFGQCLANTNTLSALTNNLGNHYTGGDIGEKDGTFNNHSAECYEPFPQTNRYKMFRVAQRYMGQVGDDLGNIDSLLTVLWLWHYPVKDGNIMMAGTETENRSGMCESQVSYSFHRGAGKQYGVPWFGNVSIFSSDWDGSGPQVNYKGYPGAETTGNSLSLMRRLMFTHYLYGCNILSFEKNWRSGTGSVSPIGMVQEAMVQTVNQYGAPGVMHAPAALLLDFWSGWMPPHFNTAYYYTWNAVGYGPGDYLTHGVFSLIYPNYWNSGYYQNEFGSLCNTPFGDCADTLLSDVTAPILSRYGVVIAAGDLASADTELRDKVESFLAGGGNFIVTGENARRIWPEFGIGPGQVAISANGSIAWADGTYSQETNSGVLYSVSLASLPAGAQVLAGSGSLGGPPAVVDIPRGAGKITLLLSPYGLNSTAITNLPPPSGTQTAHYNKPLFQPYVLMSHVQKLLSDRLSGQRLFSVGNTNLGYITCRQAPGQYWVGLYNNSLTSQVFSISSLIGPITNQTELDLGFSVTNQLGYWPLGYETNNGGISDGSHIFGGDIRLFRVQVSETNTLRVLGSNLPPARPFNRMVAIPALCNAKDTLQQWYNFFQHFDGVKLDWTGLRNGSLGYTNGGGFEIHEPIKWLQRQQVRFVIDFSSGFLTHDLTLQTNAPGANYSQSVAQFNSAMDKLALLGRGTDIIISAEDISSGQTGAFKSGVAALCANAAARGITVHFKHRTTTWSPDIASTLNFISSVGAANLKFAANTADAPGNIAGLLAQAGGQLGLILIAPPGNGNAMDLSPVRGKSVIEILDANYNSWDPIYRDACAAWVTNGAASLAGTPITPPMETYWTTHTNNVLRFYNVPDTADLPNSLRQQTNFWSYFGGAKVDYKYLAYHDPQQCATEGQWLSQRKVQVIVDFSSDLNNYPGLTLTDSSNPNDGLSANYHRTLSLFDDVFYKMSLMGITNCIIRPTTTNTAAYAYICNRAWTIGTIMVHLQHYIPTWNTTYQSPSSVANLVGNTVTSGGNFKMAINGCHDSNLNGLFSTAGGRLGLVLLGYPGPTGPDVHGQVRLGMATNSLAGRTQPQILDSEYSDWNDTAQDLAYLGWTASAPPVMPYAQATTNLPAFNSSCQFNGNGNLVFGGSLGAPGATYYVLNATNIALPLSNWSIWSTGQFDTLGNFSITSPPAGPQGFFRLLMR